MAYLNYVYRYKSDSLGIPKNMGRAWVCVVRWQAGRKPGRNSRLNSCNVLHNTPSFPGSCAYPTEGSCRCSWLLPAGAERQSKFAR